MWTRSLQVVVHNLPWTCSWQQLKDAFVEAGVANIERADVIIDSSGRSRRDGRPPCFRLWAVGSAALHTSCVPCKPNVVTISACA